MKLLHLLCIGLVAMMAASCSTGQTKTYEGTVPSEQGPENYTLTLDYNKGDSAINGTYTLAIAPACPKEACDTAKAKACAKKVKTTTGEFFIQKGTPLSGDQRFLRLNPKVGHQASEAPADNIYFLIPTDSTLSLVNSSLTCSTPEPILLTLKK